MKKGILFFCLFCSSLQGKILEVHHFREVSAHVTQESLIILDIDDTLLIPVQMLGCDEWFKHRLDLHQKKGMSFSEALENSLAEWEGIRHITRMEIVEPETDHIVREMQEKGHRIMGLSTQRLVLSACTNRQLRENRIDLSLTALTKEDCYFTVNSRGVLYQNGILFTSGSDKGLAFFKFCDAIGYQPQRIVFINDKDTHLKEIEVEAEKRNVEFIGLRYAFSDARKAAFQPEIAEIQFKHSKLRSLLSDEEAVALFSQFK